MCEPVVVATMGRLRKDERKKQGRELLCGAGVRSEGVSVVGEVGELAGEIQCWADCEAWPHGPE